METHGLRATDVEKMFWNLWHEKEAEIVKNQLQNNQKEKEISKRH